MENIKLVLSVLVLVGCDPGSPFSSFDYRTPGTSSDGDAVPEMDAHFPEDGGIDSGNETASDPSTGGAGGTPGAGGARAVDACLPVVHDNGVGQRWQDCMPLRTYNLSQALKACSTYMASHGGGNCHSAPGCGTAAHVVQTPSDDPNNYVWGYDGNTAGYVGMSGACPNPVNGKQWN